MREINAGEVFDAWRAHEGEARFAGRKASLIAALPKDTRWFVRGITLDELTASFYLAYPEFMAPMEWEELSGGTNVLLDGAAGFERLLAQPSAMASAKLRGAVPMIATYVERLRRTEDVGRLVLVSCTGQHPMVVVDGCHRATAYVHLRRAPAEMFVGVSPSMAEYTYWPRGANRAEGP